MRCLAVMTLVSWAGGVEADERWNEEGARKMVERVLSVEKTGRPWTKIGWMEDGAAAAAKAQKSGKPIMVFFHLAKGGPEQDPCGAGGRVMRSVVLADPKVQKLIAKEFVPLKVGLKPGGGFPLDWPALKPWERLFQFADARSFTGCVVVSADCEVQFGTTGSLLLWELVDAKGFDAGKLRTVLEVAAARGLEERTLRKQRGITEEERLEEIRRFRQGLLRAAQEHARFQLPPGGFSMETVLKWFGGG